MCTHFLRTWIVEELQRKDGDLSIEGFEGECEKVAKLREGTANHIEGVGHALILIMDLRINSSKQQLKNTNKWDRLWEQWELEWGQRKHDVLNGTGQACYNQMKEDSHLDFHYVCM